MSFIRHESCPQCGSSDNVAVWSNLDGSERKKCFTVGCGYHSGFQTTNDEVEGQAIYTPVALPQPAYSLPLAHRGITLDTAKTYGVTFSQDYGGIWVYPYRRYGVVVGYKAKSHTIPKGEKFHFTTHGNIKDILFGADTISTRERKVKRVAVAFGENDALATYQMTGVPCLSPSSDQAAESAIKANLPMLEEMDTVYLIPDADPSCLAIFQKLASLLEVPVKIVALKRYKDPNDYLVYHEVSAFRDEFYSAETYTPNFIVEGDDLVEEALTEIKTPQIGKPIGLPPVDDGTRGLRYHELSFILGPPYSGKSTFLWKLAATCAGWELPCYIFSSEERKGKALSALARAYNNKALNPMMSVPELVEDIRPAMRYVAAHRDGGEMTADQFRQAVSFAYRVKGYRLFFIDNLSSMVGGTSDQWAEMNRLIMVSRSLASKYPIHIFWVAHTSRGTKEVQLESGYGTSYLEKIADNMLGVERQQNVTIRVLKCRAHGLIGLNYTAQVVPDSMEYMWQVQETTKKKEDSSWVRWEM